jgi:hypothetical protein
MVVDDGGTGSGSTCAARRPASCTPRTTATRWWPGWARTRCAGRRPERAWQRISRSRVVVGALLMDQSVLAGVGNVYRAEVLYRAGLSPFRPGRDVPRSTFDACGPTCGCCCAPACAPGTS